MKEASFKSSEVNRIAALDFMTIKPYFTKKNLIIMLIQLVLWLFITKKVIAAFYVVNSMVIMFINYPFLIGENAGIDALYTLIGIKRDNVVKGRYFTGFIMILISAVFLILFTLLISPYFEGTSPFEIILIGISSAAFPILSMIITYPIHFKYGYAKSVQMAGGSLMIFILLSILISYSIPYLSSIVNLIKSYPYLLAVLLVVLLVGSAILSIRMSVKNYVRRDF